jgi:hypothetical protein
MTMKMVAIVLVSIALITGIASAIFWWLSSRASFVITTFGHITDADGWVITSRDLETYLQRVGRLNAWAAGFGAVSVTSSAAASLISVL